MAASNPEAPAARRWVWPAVLAGATALLFAVYPPFRVVPLRPDAGAAAQAGPAAFDAAAAAAQFWETELQPAARTDATALADLVRDLRADPAGARATHGRVVGVGGRAYYFVQGSGRLLARERSLLILEPAGAPGTRLALRTGPVFGNTVRDASGRLDVNAFPGLTEFNALAAALNLLVEERVLPALRADLPEGATIDFAGAVEVPADLPADPAAPLLAFIPIRAEVR
jgi:predicted lipoprotein